MPEQTFQSRTKLNEFDASLGLDRGASRFKETLWYLVKTFIFLSALPYPSSLKVKILRLFGAKIGKGVVIKPRVNIHLPWKLEVGDHVWMGEEVFILNFEQVTIGNNVSVSQQAFLCCGNHDYKVPSMPYRNAPITLEDGCWVGAQCFVGPGVKIGIDSVLAAGSILTKSIDANGIYSGNPAIFVKKRWNDNDTRKIDSKENSMQC